MKTRRNVAVLIICVTASLATTGCSRTHQLTVDENWQTDQLRELNEKAAKKRVTLTLATGRQVQAEALRMDPETVTWLDPQTRETRSAPSGDVFSVSYKSHGRGALEGLGIGMLAGVLIGAPLAYSSGDDPPCARDSWLCIRFDADEKATMGGIGGAGLGSLLGLLIGVGTGGTEEYLLKRQP